MPDGQQISYGGAIHQFPSNFSDADVSDALSQWDKENPKAHAESINVPDNVDARARQAGVVDKLRRTINTPAGGMGYGQPTVPKAKDTGIISGITRGVENLIDLPGQVFGAPKTPDEKGIASTVDSAMGKGSNWPLSRAIVGAKRMFVDPAAHAEDRAEEYDLMGAAHPERERNGVAPSQMSRMYRASELVPGIGPYAASLTERALGGDPGGAVAEAITAREGVPTAAKMLKRTAGKVAYPMAEEMANTPTGRGEINPSEAYNGTDIKSHAENLGINLTPAEITENGTLRAVQGVGQKSAFGKDILQKHQAAAQSKLIKAQRTDMDTVSPGQSNDLQVGRGIVKQVTDAAKRSKDAANQAYADWRMSLPDGPIDIDLSELRKKYGNLMDTNKDVFDNIPTEQAGRLKGMIGKAKDFGAKSVDEEGNVDINPRMDLDAVREMRSHWLDTQRELARKGRADSREAGLATDVAKDLDTAIERGLQEHGEFHAPTGAEAPAAGQALVNGWRNANAKWKQYVNDFHGDDSVLADILDSGERDLSKLPGRILDKSTGGNPTNISQLRNHQIDLGGLQRSIMDRSLNQGYRMSQNRLAGFDDDFLQHVFADKPEVLDKLYKNARVGRSVGIDFNPSNTAGTMLARGELEAAPRMAVDAATGNTGGLFNSALSTVFGRAAAKLSTAGWFKDWMTRTPNGPIGRWLTRKPGQTGPGQATQGPGGGGSTGPADGSPSGQSGPPQPTGSGSPTGDVSQGKSLLKREGEYANSGDADFNFGVNSIPTGEVSAEGRPTTGTGPGAMLAKGAKLLIRQTKSGPMTGDTATPILKEMLENSEAQRFFPKGLTGNYDPSDVLIDPEFKGKMTLSPDELRSVTPVQEYVDPTIVNHYMDALREHGDVSAESVGKLPAPDPDMQPDNPPHLTEDLTGRRVMMNGTHRTIAHIKADKPMQADAYGESGELVPDKYRTGAGEADQVDEYISDLVREDPYIVSKLMKELGFGSASKLQRPSTPAVKSVSDTPSKWIARFKRGR